MAGAAENEAEPLSWRVGAVTVTRIVETELRARAGEEHSFLPDATPGKLRRHSWLYPHFVSDDDEMILSVHALLVEAPGLRLVVDTCIGNDKPRRLLGGRALATGFLDALAAVGWTRDSVDAVVCTHMHVDHVGWNTMLEGGAWVPTFPNARYLLGRLEYEHWSAQVDDADQVPIMADSVQPILDAGLADLVEVDHRISPEVRLVPTLGHTPGHVSVVIESGGQSAVITGDMTHHACQLAEPDWSPLFDVDRAASARTRWENFARWADAGMLLIGTHYPAPTGGMIVRDGKAFRLA